MHINLKSYLLIFFFISFLIPFEAIALQDTKNIIDYKLVENQVLELEHNFNVHSYLFIKLYKQLFESQCYIDNLRNQIQKNKHLLSQIKKRKKNLSKKKDNIKQYHTKLFKNPVDGNNPSIQHAIEADYKKALAITLNNKQFNKAIKLFQSFLKHYPDSIYSSNANYWLGQLNYHNGKKDNSVCYFLSVVKNYPKSNKADDSLLKIDIIMKEKKQKTTLK